MQKAYSYIRFSDPRQAEGDSYKRQLRDTLAYCAANHLELVSDSAYMFFDAGISAYSGKLRDDTTELSRFLSLVQNKSIPHGSTLIVESLDRLSREHVRKALVQFLELLDAGINIHTLHSKKTYTHDSKDDMDLFQSILEMSRSHNESRWKGERIASSWEKKQDQARNGVPMGNSKPAWLDLEYKHGKDQKPTGFIKNGKVAVVEKIFQYTLDGYGRNVVARMLNAEGIPAFKTEKGWGQSSVQQVLTNEAVLGIYQPYTKGKDGKREARGEPIMYYPPIVSRKTFDSARAATAGRDAGKGRKQTPEFQVWQGVAKCASCGSPLHSYSNGRKPKEGTTAARWMRCYQAKKGNCEAGSISVRSMEPVFPEILAKLNIVALVQSSATAINAKLEEVVGQLVAERSKLQKFKKDYAERRSDTIRDLLYETEDRVTALVAQEQQYLTDLAADQIIDKEQFFARLDLASYTGRSRANNILKRLKVTVHIDTAALRYQVVKDGVPVFDLIDHAERGIVAYPASPELAAIIQRQDGSFTPRLHDDEDAEDQQYPNEGYDSSEQYQTAS